MRYSLEKSQEFPSGNPSRARKISIHRDEIREIKCGFRFVFVCVERCDDKSGRSHTVFFQMTCPDFPDRGRKRKWARSEHALFIERHLFVPFGDNGNLGNRGRKSVRGQRFLPSIVHARRAGILPLSNAPKICFEPINVSLSAHCFATFHRRNANEARNSPRVCSSVSLCGTTVAYTRDHKTIYQ